ncbi:flippase [Hufsiella ginkgonis]|uniref:Oligosaccharide flippase family protein n=1 Tax=Hufsiella ginkgonis TaxID=2695274 RepID=A0A7K1Y281_9SPHI|nr:flippase [Hufsiella ginkgonis]MXV17383.1 oligosaccharide flippase family protein [Hufsiella ginkgonis]
MVSVKKNLVYSILLSLSQLLFPLVTFPYASRVLLPRGIGAVSFADSFTQYFILFASVGLPLYGVREVSKAKDDRVKLDRLFSELMLISLGFTLLYLVVYIACIFTVPKLYSSRELYFVGCCILLSNAFMIDWFYQGLENFSFIVKRTLVLRCLIVAGMFVWVREPADMVIYYALTLAAFAGGAAVNQLYALKWVTFTLTGLDFKKHLKPMLYIFASSVFISVYTIMDTIILGFLTNDTVVGYYSASARISKISLVVIGALGTALVPRLAAVFSQGHAEEARKLLATSASYVITLSVPLSIGTWVMAPELVSMFGGAAFMPSVSSLRIFAIVVIILGFAQIYSNQLLIPLNKEKFILRSVLAGVLVNLVLSFALIPRFKHDGAAFANVATEAVVTVMMAWYAAKFFRFPVPARFIIQSVVSCLFFVPARLLVAEVWPGTIFGAALAIILSAITYVILQLVVFKNELINGYYRSFRNRLAGLRSPDETTFT